MLSQLEFKVAEPVNDDLARIAHDWLRQAVFFVGASWYTNRKEFKTLYEVSGKLKLRWLYSHNRVKVAIEQKERHRNWIGGYSIGNQDPFLLECYSFDDVEIVEGIVRVYLPQIEIVKCQFCGNRFGNTLIENGWCCDKCQSDFSTKERDRTGFVYIFGSVATGYFKIGCGDRPASRLRDYERSKLPFPVEMIHTIPVDDKVMAEAELHRLFRENRTNGEWFKLTDEELGKITSLKKYVAGHWIKE